MKKVLALVLSIAVILTMGLSVLSVSAADQLVFWTLDHPYQGGGWNGYDPKKEVEGYIDMSGETIDAVRGWFGVMEGKECTGVKLVVDGVSTVLTKGNGLVDAEDLIKDACNQAFDTLDTTVGYYTRVVVGVDPALSEGDHTVELIATVDGEDVLIAGMTLGEGYQGGAEDPDPTEEPSNTSEPTQKPTDPTKTPDKTPDKKPDNSKTGDSSMIFAVAAAGIVLTVLFKKKIAA